MEGKVKQQQAIKKIKYISVPSGFVFVLDFELTTAAKH